MTTFLGARFLAFVAASVLGYWVLPRVLRPVGLLAANLSFLFLLLGARGAAGVLALVVLVHVLGRLQDGAVPGRRARWTVIGIALLLGGFFLDRLWLRRGVEPGWNAAGGLVGYSYLAFRLINALLLGQEGVRPPGSLLDFLNFSLFFPSFTAGPIDSIRDWRERGASAELDAGLLAHGMSRVLTGLIKKYVLASWLAPYTLLSHAHPGEIPSPAAAWILTAGFSLLVYLDFSGYTDVAVGVGKCLGYRLPENFDRPFLQPNLLKFWERWHMSLTGWLRSQVFIPLSLWGGARLAYPGTMLLVGLWHGFAWRWVLFGLLHGAALVLLREWSVVRPRWLGPEREARWKGSAVVALLSIAATFAFTALSFSLILYSPADFGSLLRRCVGG